MILPWSSRGLAQTPRAETRINSLALCVIRVVDHLHPHLAARSPLTHARTVFEFRVLLAIITYCYAAGAFASEEIEAAMRDDRSFRAVCHEQFPCCKTIREFRRRNRSSIEQCLAAVLARVEPGSPAMKLAGKRLPRPKQTHEDRAAELVEQAMFIDLMIDENS